MKGPGFAAAVAAATAYEEAAVNCGGSGPGSQACGALAGAAVAAAQPASPAGHVMTPE